ncbi:MAG: HAMP domain-containing protein [Gammaproteobacteria bacterium]
MNRQSYSLRIKVMLGLAIFLGLVALQSAYQLHVLDRARVSHALLGELSQLDHSIQTLAQPSENYLKNAARDYESYRRDVMVFHKDILNDFARLDARMATIDERFKQGAGETPVIDALLGGSAHAELGAAVQDAEAAWRDFNATFMDKLGPDEAEPRLEWGTEYVVENHPRLAAAVQRMTSRYRALLDEQHEMSVMLLDISLAALAVFGALGLVWFYRRVIHRIGKTVDACQIVAGGDFGYTLPVEGRDEISVLSRAFNTLSSRSHLVLNMVVDLQQSVSVEQALAVIVQGSGNYLPVSWAGFMEVSSDGKRMSLSNAIPPKSLQGWGDRTATAEQEFGRALADALISKQSVNLSDLPEQVIDMPDEAFLRGLVRATQVKSLLALPVSGGSGWEGVLLFGSRNGEYRQDHAELLEKLAPLMAASLERTVRVQTDSRARQTGLNAAVA